jgi:hypothetical protein
MYTADGRRFEVPLAYLGTTVFGELLRMSQEEFGLAWNSGIILPFDSAVMEYVMCLLRRNASEEVEKAFLSCRLPIFKLYGATCSAAPAACSLYLLNICRAPPPPPQVFSICMSIRCKIV